MSGETVEAFGARWRRVWAEDECTRGTPGHVTDDGAWLARYSEPMPAFDTTAHHEDWGDAYAHRLHPDRMLVDAGIGSSIWEREP